MQRDAAAPKPSASSDVDVGTPSRPRIVDADFPKRLVVGRLRNTLRANAVFSGVGGVAALGAGTWIGELLGTGHGGIVRAVGGSLVLFAVALVVVAGARASKLHRWALPISLADGCWVVASVATLGAGWYSTIGVAIVGVVASVVAALGARQAQLWRRLRSELESLTDRIDDEPPIEVFHVERRVPDPRQVAWQVVTDHRLYGEVAPNLSEVRLTGGRGGGFVRTCTNTNGEQWSEECTLWEDGSCFEVDVDTDDYPYPLALMRGSWWVRPDAPGWSVLGMDFCYQPRRGIRGHAFAAFMQAAFPFVLRRILRGWEAEIAVRS